MSLKKSIKEKNLVLNEHKEKLLAYSVSQENLSKKLNSILVNEKVSEKAKLNLKPIQDKIKEYSLRIANVDKDRKRLTELESLIKKQMDIETHNREVENKIIQNKAELKDLKGKEKRHKSLLEQAKILKESYFDNNKCRKCKLMACALKAREELKYFDTPALRVVKKIQESLESDLIDVDVVDKSEYDSLKKSLAEMDFIKGALNDLKKDEVKFKNEIDDFESKGKDIATSELSKLDIKVSGTQNTIDHLSEQIAQDRTALDRIIDARKVLCEIQKRHDSIKNSSKNQNNYKYIANSFSKTGIPALLIDEAIPILQGIAYNLLQRATNNKFDIEFSTLRKKKDGGYSESLEIICTDEKGSRDISEFSGGEQRLLKMVLRLTLSIFMSEKSSIKYQTLFLDEAFENLDSENSTNIIDLLEEVSRKEFSRVVLVSHEDDLLKEIEGRIEL